MEPLNDGQKIYYLVSLFIYSILTLNCFYTSYFNLIKNRFSKFGFDRLIIEFFAKKHLKKNVENNKTRIKRSGIVILLIGLGGVLGLIEMINKYIPLIF